MRFSTTLNEHFVTAQESYTTSEINNNNKNIVLLLKMAIYTKYKCRTFMNLVDFSFSWTNSASMALERRFVPSDLWTSVPLIQSPLLSLLCHSICIMYIYNHNCVAKNRFSHQHMNNKIIMVIMILVIRNNNDILASYIRIASNILFCFLIVHYYMNVECKEMFFSDQKSTIKWIKYSTKIYSIYRSKEFYRYTIVYNKWTRVSCPECIHNQSEVWTMSSQ